MVVVSKLFAREGVSWGEGEKIQMKEVEYEKKMGGGGVFR